MSSSYILVREACHPTWQIESIMYRHEYYQFLTLDKLFCTGEQYCTIAAISTPIRQATQVTEIWSRISTLELVYHHHLTHYCSQILHVLYESFQI